MAWAIWLSYTTISAANIVTPGPANLNTLRRALQLGFMPVLPTIFGNALGLAVGGILCAGGVAAFVVKSGVLWTVFQWLGVAYLGGLGLKLIIKREHIDLGSGLIQRVPPWPQSALLVLTYCGLSILSLSTYALLAEKVRERFLTQARYDIFRVCSGLVLIGFAVKLAL